MDAVFVSSSGASDRELIRLLTRELEGSLHVMHQGIFRGPHPDPVVARAMGMQPHQALHFHWCEQLTYTRRAAVMVVVLTGEERKADGRRGLSDGMMLEVLDVIWRGTPVIWVATKEAGIESAAFHHEQYHRNYPFVVSHFVEALPGRRVATLRALANLCIELAEIRRPELPVHVSAGATYTLRYQPHRPTRNGWERADLEGTQRIPQVLVSYGTHIVNSPYWSPPPCAYSEHRFSGEVVERLDGSSIVCPVTPPKRGYGTMRLRWTDDNGGAVNDPGLGSSLLSWDFVCEFPWPGF